MKPRVFVQTPHHRPSGGIKVNHRLVNLFREKGYEAYLFTPTETITVPDWFHDPSPHIISNDEMLRLCQKEDLVIGGWPDRISTAYITQAAAYVKIFYSQGSTFPSSATLLGDQVFSSAVGYTHFWAVGETTKKVLEQAYNHQFHVVYPYFDKTYIQKAAQKQDRNKSFLALNRSGRGDVYIQFVKFIFRNHISICSPTGPFTEDEFFSYAAANRFFLHTSTGWRRSIRKHLSDFIHGRERMKLIYAQGKHIEGFPLPPAEAALAGAVVVGFDSMGGESDWMDETSAFLAPDGDYWALYKVVQQALTATKDEIEEKRRNAQQSLARFHKDYTWSQIERFLNTV